MYSLKNLQAELNTLCDRLENEYDINCGGCCYIAYLISKHLERLNITYSLIIRDYEKIPVMKALQEVKSRNVNNIITGCNTRSHYYITLNNLGINSHTSAYYKCQLNNISSNDIRWIYNTGWWNSYYNTKNNKKIAAIIKKFFNNYIKENNL